MKVKFFATLREITNTKELEIEAIDIKSLLNKLIEIYGNPLKEALFQDDKLRQFVKVLHNGQDIDFKQGFKTKLKKEDIVSIFPPIGGG